MEDKKTLNLGKINPDPNRIYPTSVLLDSKSALKIVKNCYVPGAVPLHGKKEAEKNEIIRGGP